MSLRTVSEAIKTAINGQTYGNFQPLNAQTDYHAVVLAGSTPQAWIIPDEGSENRWTAPRGSGGLKNQHHHVKIYLEALFAPSSTAPLLSMRDLVDGIMATLRTMTMPQVLVDPITNRSWQLLSIGEYYQWIKKPPEVSASQRILDHTATVTVSALEAASV